MEEFFAELVKFGGKVRFFEKLRFSFKTNIFVRNHRRDHRKIGVIDDTICYLGSSNITDYNLSWREAMIRIEDSVLGEKLDTIFKEMFAVYNKYFFDKSLMIKSVSYQQSMEILRDVPSMRRQPIKKKYIELINSAAKSIYLETPYFLPSSSLRKALVSAVKRGVEVVCILPKKSDVGMVDVLRNRYLGPLHQAGIKFLFYVPNNLHAKIALFDENTFILGSPNFDYRSFRYQHEIILCGKKVQISRQLNSHLETTMKDSEPFDFENWKNRHNIERIFEWLIIPFRHLL